MSTKPKPIAILISDLHLQLTAPVARSDEPSWLAAMERDLARLRNFQVTCGRVPIICAGDIFDHWGPKPELINWAMEHLPHSIHAIPGQHDLPMHAMADIKKSAFSTLVQADAIKLLPMDGVPYILTPELRVHSFGWGQPVMPCSKGRIKGWIDLCVAHEYIWIPQHGYTGAPKPQQLGREWSKRLSGYHAAVFGDNHQSFLTTCGDCNVLNHGTFFRRKSDERVLPRCHNALLDDGTIARYQLNTSAEMWVPYEEAAREEQEASTNLELMQELEKLGAHGLDFVTALQHYMRQNVSAGGRRILTALLNGPR